MTDFENRCLKEPGLLFLLLAILIIGCSPATHHESATTSAGNFTFPPEWEPHDAMWIDWTDFALDTRVEMIDAFHRHVNVNLLTFSDSMASLAWEMMLDKNIDTSKVDIFVHPIPNYFIRDAGPKYLTDGTSYMLADFGWNCFGGAQFDSLCLRRGEIDNDLAGDFGYNVRGTDIRVEGGALEVSTNEIIAFKEMALHRNPGRAIEEIERVYLDMYGKKKMIWIDKKLLLEVPGHKIDNYFGQGANGHIDDYMRFVNDSTILVGVITEEDQNANPINRVDYERLQHNLRQVRAATNHQDKSFRIITVPMPDVTPYAIKAPLTNLKKEKYPELYANFNTGDTIVTVPIMSYLNFTISNGVVLIHRYWHDGIPETEKAKDELFFNLMTELFPGREIVQINPLSLNWNGGGIHCATQQVPAVAGARKGWLK